MKVSDHRTILESFEHRPDGAWCCTAAVVIETPEGPLAVEPGTVFVFGEKVGQLDLAEYLERLGAQFGS
ncbi:hypothetical protein [Enterovirga sp.]|jgi:hypothetical protein|uniref:hypothetical protein n=1 Tax=Enterovirga sp. TaxID=2026350 RepID=UPI00261FB1B5|nr:hypothetical protein [Enterovirga sp.]MDB5591300.1 hypothetical protein [Enterovirga sp.]